jgi:hypothetical protein
MAWLGRQDVRAALHAAPVAELPWQPCSDKLHYRTGGVAMVPVHRELVQRGGRRALECGRDACAKRSG